MKLRSSQSKSMARPGRICCGLVFLSLFTALAEDGIERADAKKIADEVIAAMATLDAREKAALAGDTALLKQVVQLTVSQRLLLQEARAGKWDERPEVKAKLERVRDSALAEGWLQSIVTPPADYPGEEEIKAAYDAQKASLATPRQLRIAQIFIACPKNADKTVHRKAATKLDAVKQKLASYKEDFAAIARSDSEEKVSASAGGEIGWLTEAQIQPELRPFIVKLIKHEVSSPVRLSDGWHILKCLDKREAGTPALEDMRGKLAAQLRAEKMKANSEAYLARLAKENPVEVDEAAVAKLCAEGVENFKLQSSTLKETSNNKSQTQASGKTSSGDVSD
jgi:parvulin-like peptidyl-prolyl isomerase